MSYYFMAALISALVGVLPLILRRRFGAGFVVGLLGFFALWGIYYLSLPSTVWPLFGLPGFCTAMLWAVSTVVDAVITEEENDRLSYRDPGRKHSWAWVFPVTYMVLLLGSAVYGSGMLNAGAYSKMIGTVTERNWSADIQPKDPRHMIMVSNENATYIARKAVGSAGAIGSQFGLDSNYMTIQRVNGSFYHVVPFDYNGFSVWLNAPGSPGFMLIDAEDPERNPRLVELPKGGEMKYMPGAYFEYNLERHLRNNGFISDALSHFKFELDENEKPWWIIVTYEPTITWSGAKVTGVATVNPVTGDITRYDPDKVPAWVDRIVPADFVHSYIDWWGGYSGGWLNSWWGKHRLLEAENPILIYGTSDRAEWVTGVTSTSGSDDSLVGLMYTDSRTGQSVYYLVPGGGTETAILQAVNANEKVKYKHLHGSTPQIYNIYGKMAAVVPLLNESDAYQGVSIVSVENVQDVAVGSTQNEALRNYQAILSRHGQQVALANSPELQELSGVVDRISQDVGLSGSVYYVHLTGVPRLFTASSQDYPKLVVTQPGDKVTMKYVASGEGVVPLSHFENVSLPLDETEAQKELDAAVQTKAATDKKSAVPR